MKHEQLVPGHSNTCCIHNMSFCNCKGQESGDKPWFDILLDAAREGKFAERISGHHLATFARAIEFELGNRRRMSLYEAEQYVDEFENVAIAYFKSSTATNSGLFCATKEKLIRALTGAPKKEAPIPKNPNLLFYEFETDLLLAAKALESSMPNAAGRVRWLASLLAKTKPQKETPNAQG